MFDNNVFLQNSCHNVSKDGKIIGYGLRTYITYYRGIPLSMVNDIQVEIDGEKATREDILFSAEGDDWFTLDEMETVTTYKWEYDQAAFILVKKEGGLSKGKHDVKLTVITRTAYIPVPLKGEKCRQVIIE
jgi:hypothetical protein